MLSQQDQSLGLVATSRTILLLRSKARLCCCLKIAGVSHQGARTCCTRKAHATELSVVLAEVHELQAEQIRTAVSITISRAGNLRYGRHHKIAHCLICALPTRLLGFLPSW